MFNKAFFVCKDGQSQDMECSDSLRYWHGKCSEPKDICSETHHPVSLWLSPNSYLVCDPQPHEIHCPDAFPVVAFDATNNEHTCSEARCANSIDGKNPILIPGSLYPQWPQSLAICSNGQVNDIQNITDLPDDDDIYLTIPRNLEFGLSVCIDNSEIDNIEIFNSCSLSIAISKFKS
jgi:hypothetical protein